MNTPKTFRRDRLLRLARAGKLVMVESYHYDDMTGSSRSKDERPVRVLEQGGDREEGVAYVYASDFEGNCGRAYQGASGVITLHVHSNCNYTFKIKE
jgi:hypothetical protein